MVNDSKVVGVEPDRMVFDRFSGYRTKPGQTWGRRSGSSRPRGAADSGRDRRAAGA
jgi:hypothetical protein